MWNSGSYPPNDIAVWAATYDPANGLGTAKSLWAAGGPEVPDQLSLSVSPNGRAVLAMDSAGVASVSFYSRVWAVVQELLGLSSP